MHRKFQTELMVVLVLCSQVALSRQATQEDSSDKPFEDPVVSGDGQLYEQMGAYDRQFTTNSKLAQKYLSQGMVWIHAFNHGEALRSFTKAAKLDPQCAWAWWGIAHCEGPYYNSTELTDEQSVRCWYAVQNALARIKNASEVERALIEAEATRYANPQPKNRKTLDKAYANAMSEVWQRFPKDPDVGYLYAESMMILEPWTLYSRRREPKDGTMEIRSVLETVMKLEPIHAGAKHLYIHAVEASANPADALQAARELNDMVPDAGHLLHMPSHIYVQTGHWEAAIVQNAKAVESDSAYRARVPEPSINWRRQAHNAHMLAFAAMMSGQERLAMKYAGVIWEMIPANRADEIAPQLDVMLMTRYDVQKRFGRWDALLAEKEPADYLPVTRAFWRAHRAIALAAKKQIADARNEHKLFREAKAAVPDDLARTGSKFLDVLEISDHFIAGEIALQQENWDEAVEHLKQAAELEYLLAYTEPPYWLQPVRHTLGAVYMKAGRFQDAEKAYREDLTKWNENGWSLYGLSQALKSQGKEDEAKDILARLSDAWAHAEAPLTTSCKCIEHLSK